MIRKSSLFLAALGLLSACGGSSFSGESGSAPGRPKPAKVPAQADSRVPEIGTDASKPTLDVNPDGTLKKCPSKEQKVLIIDLKSGWWSGDGGNFVYRIGDGLTKLCGTSVSLEYHHLILAKQSLIGALVGAQAGAPPPAITNMQLKAPERPTLQPGSTNFEQAFEDPTFASYSQIWILSGSSADPADLQTNHPFFAEITKRVVSSKANIFIGAGYGSITHAAAIAEAKAMGASFSTALPEGNILNPMAKVVLNSSIGPDKFNKEHVLLKGLTSVADQLTVDGVKAHGDVIQDKGGINVLATDGLGQASIAVGKSEANGARFVLDADLPRYYAGWTNQSPDTVTLLQNIAVYLAQ